MKPKTNERGFLHCEACNMLLQMTEHRGIYCPKCKMCRGVSDPKYILCCSDCNEPLAVTVGNGSYCKHCNFPPSMQDTFLLERSKIPPVL